VLTVLQDFIKSAEPGIAAAEDKVRFGALHKSLVDPQGEITVRWGNRDNVKLKIPFKTWIYKMSPGPPARQKSDPWHSWSDVFGALLDNYCARLRYYSALFSYRFDLVIRVSQRHATLKTLDDSVEMLTQKDGNV
jgi:hypothetical protein